MIKLLLAVLACAYPATIRDLDSRDFRTRHAARLSLQGQFLAIPALSRPAATPEGDRLREELLDAMNWRRTAALAWLRADDETLLRHINEIGALGRGTVTVRWGGRSCEVCNYAPWMRQTPYFTGDAASEVRAFLEAVR